MPRIEGFKWAQIQHLGTLLSVPREGAFICILLSKFHPSDVSSSHNFKNRIYTLKQALDRTL